MTAPTVATGVAAYYALDAAYRAATARTSLAVARILLAYWRVVDPENLTGTTDEWMTEAVRAVIAGQSRATQLANAYTEQVRRLSAPDASPFTPVNPRPPNAEQIRTSMEFLAIKKPVRKLYALEESLKGEPQVEPEELEREATSRRLTFEGRRQQIIEQAIKDAMGASIRYVTTAGHDQIKDNVQADPVALGWVRTTKPGSCHFCAMLASRGAVYKKDSFALSDPLFDGPGEHKVHDNCGCGLRPVYTEGDPLPDRVAELDEMWAESQRQRKPGESALNAFRRLYSTSPLAQPPGTVEA